MKMVGIGLCYFLNNTDMSKNFNKLDFLNNYHDKKPIVIKNYFDVSRLSWNKINEIIERSNIYANDFKIAYHGIVEKCHYLETFCSCPITTANANDEKFPNKRR